MLCDDLDSSPIPPISFTGGDCVATQLLYKRAINALLLRALA